MKVQRSFGVVAMDASSFALRISWLKFEPKVSNFPVKETVATVSFTNATIKVRCIFIFCTDKSLWVALTIERNLLHHKKVYIIKAISCIHVHEKRLCIVARVI